MDTTLMPWFAGAIILLVAAMLYFLTRAYLQRGKGRRKDRRD